MIEKKEQAAMLMLSIKEAQKKIDLQYEAGLISKEEYTWFGQMIRRTGDYGSKWLPKRQAEMRANLLKEF